MSDSTPSAQTSDVESPAVDADVEMKSPEANGALSESDAGTPRSAKRKSPTPSEDDEVAMGGGGDELFGDDDEGGDALGAPEDDEDAPSPGKKRRLLDDEELDSGDDEGRRDRITDDDNDEAPPEEEKEEDSAEVVIGRHLTPKGSDGEVYLLKFPHFLGIERKGFTLKSFQAPTTNHHSKQASTTFSALQTANNTIRWRRNPHNPRTLQSNSRIIRWSDGSLTLQVGSSPLDQHELPAVPFAPPQRDPKRPTPISKRQQPPLPYNAKADTHTYLVAQHSMYSLAQITNHITAALSVQTTEEEEDAAVLALQAAMAQHTGAGAAAGGGGKDAAGTAVIALNEDPELAKRRAEQAEKEKVKAERRRMAQAEREREKTHRVLGRAGVRGAAGLPGGLTAGGLEGDELGMGVGAGRGRGAKKAPGARKQRRRRDSYTDEDEDEDYGRRGRTREDEYDEDDGFLVGSDEELEVMEDDDEEEEEPLSDGGGKASPAPKEEQGGDSGTGGAGQGGGRLKRRKVLDDEDEDEDGNE